MANRSRGEVVVEVGVEKYTLRPTFEAMEQIEDAVGVGIPAIIQRGQEGDVRFKDVVSILHAGVVAYYEGDVRKAPTRAQIGAQVVAAGLGSVLKQGGVIRFLIYGMAGSERMEALVDKEDDDTPGEVKAAEAK